MGLRDNNEASWTQVLEILEFMADVTTIPILVDGDTGYGNFNNLRRAVRKLGQRDIAGICIEDKLFPKTNSFIGDNQPLADIDEFCGKIKAAKDSQLDDDFCVVARTEALISGRGLPEALRRGEAYRDAGADAILIHSKKPEADEILAFLGAWESRVPVIIVPTTYYETPTSAYRDAGVSTVIWANHNLRAAITAMREVSRRIHRDETLVGVEKGIARVDDVFALTGNQELAEAERRYLPVCAQSRAIVLAASRGKELGKLTADRPKCMIDVGGQPLLSRLVATLNGGGVYDITVVRGYRKEMVNLPAVRTIDNDRYEFSGEAATLACAADRLEGDCFIAYGDILFRQYILARLLAAEGDIVLAVDALWVERESSAEPGVRDLAVCTQPFKTGYLDDAPVFLKRMVHALPSDQVNGEWIGLARVNESAAALVRTELEAMDADGTLESADLIDLFNRLVEGGREIRVIYVTGHWLDVDNPIDLANAQRFL